MASIANPWTRSYYDARRADFIKLTTNTDLARVRALTQSEALEVYQLVGENMGLHEKVFAKRLEDSYICDGDKTRLKRIKRSEAHRATQGGAYEYAKSADANWKRRITAGDERVRDEHAEDAAAGWIPIDEDYPVSGESFPGSDSVNCRCSEQFSFDEEMPQD